MKRRCPHCGKSFEVLRGAKPRSSRGESHYKKALEGGIKANLDKLPEIEAAIRACPKRHFRLNDLDLPYRKNQLRFLMPLLENQGFIERRSHNSRGILYLKLDQGARPDCRTAKE